MCGNGVNFYLIAIPFACRVTPNLMFQQLMGSLALFKIFMNSRNDLIKRVYSVAMFEISNPRYHDVNDEQLSTLLWRHIDRDGVPNHQRLDCLLNP